MLLLHPMSALPGLFSAALAFESDQWTDRGRPLQDASTTANEKVDEMLAEAVVAANHRTRCAVEPEEARRILAHEVHAVVGKTTRVPERGELPSMTFGAYAAWLETAPVDRRTFDARDDLYSTIKFKENPLLATYGPASTLRFGDVLVGTDKIDHFWVQGYLYWKRSRAGKDKERPVAWGTYTERAYWGTATTNVFSYADLAANYNGFLFYDTLLETGSVLQLDGDGCIVQVRPFEWSDWVDWEFDEAQNPPAYEPEILQNVRAYVAENRERICHGLTDEEIRTLTERIEAATQEALPYVSGKAPPRVAPFDLDDLCRGHGEHDD